MSKGEDIFLWKASKSKLHNYLVRVRILRSMPVSQIDFVVESSLTTRGEFASCPTFLNPKPWKSPKPQMPTKTNYKDPIMFKQDTPL